MRTNNEGLVELNRAATLRCVELVAAVRPEDLGRATPCAEWDLAALIAHMTVQHRGFASAARGAGASVDWTPSPLAGDFAAEYAAAAHEALDAFDEPGVLERDFVLTEIPAAASFPGAQAVGFHFIDAVVHGWDVARSIGVEYVMPDSFAEPAVRIASAVPGGSYRELPGAAFGPMVAAGNGAKALDTVLAALGRSPAWSASSCLSGRG